MPKNPVNPYGATKLEVEGLLAELAGTRGLQAVALRYFNAAGAEARGRVGEWHEDETHLIPRMFQAVMRGEPFQMFGTDYPTADGTAVRDYVHVSDLAQAHESAMLRLIDVAGEAPGRFETYNLGSEKGYSVREMVAACERAIGRKVPVVERARRPGDPPHLVADASRAAQVLGFRTPSEGALERIFESAWRWEQQLADLSRNAGKAVFLDRDGTINFDPGYLSKPDQMQLIPGVGAALKRLKDAGYGLAVVSNQSGVGRGIIRRGDLPLIHARMDELLAEHGVRIDHYELCTHRPDEDCACRKPKAKLLLDSARALGADPARSYMVGDKLSDLEAGVNAGCRGSVLVRTGYGKDTETAGTGGAAAFTGNSLVEAAEWILAQESASP